MACVLEDVSGDITDPSDWNLIGSQQDFWFDTAHLKVWWREADGTGTDTPTITITDGKAQAGIIRINGQAASPYDTQTQGEDATNPITVSDVTIAEDGSLAVAVIASYLADDGDCSATGYTQRSINGADPERVLSFLTGDFDSGTGGGADFSFSSGLRYAYNLSIFKPAVGGANPAARLVNSNLLINSGSRLVG